jgi:uncharacterized membrane protein YgcG
VPVAAGDLGASSRSAIDRAIRAAEQTCRFEFSVFVGAAEGEARPFAERLHASLVAPDRSLLVMVDPDRRLLEVVTGQDVRRCLSDAEVELAVAAMQDEFVRGDLSGGLQRGIALLAEHARTPRTLHA